MATLCKIKLSNITPNQYQPRTEFSKDNISELAESIKENGLLQPISVRERKDGMYELIAGERRYRACLLLGLEEIDAIVSDADDLKSAELAVIENIQREDLTSIELAKSFNQLLFLTGSSQSELAQKLGISQASIANKIRLLALIPEAQDAITSRWITERHGRAMLACNPEQQKKLLDLIIKKEMTVAQTDEYVSKHYLGVRAKKKSKSKCYGVSQKLIINSVKDVYRKAKMLTKDVDLVQQETDEAYIMTITIKK